jgi:AcrR family transcriptional regulator
MPAAKPSAKPRDVERRSARERLLAAASELFYEEGIQTVGIDRVIERAGVAKASLYDVFGSKEELIRSYLQALQETRVARFEQGLAKFRTPRDRLLGVFDVLGDLTRAPSFRGCAFMRASAELRPESSVRGAIEASRAWMRSLLAGLAKEAGAAQPERLARQLQILYDGAVLSAQLDGDVHAPATARAAAAQMVDEAIAARARR